MLPFEIPTDQSLQGLTVAALIDLRARQMPHRVALSAQSVAGFRDRLSYAQLALYQRRVGAGLARQGLRAGDRVAVYLDNHAGREAVLTALGAMALGAIVVPVNTRSADDQLASALALVKPSLVVTAAASAARVRALCGASQSLVGMPASEGAPPGATHWPEPTTETPFHELRLDVLADAPACMLYTSGTTAQAKAVVHTHRSMLHAGLAMGMAVGLNASDLYQGAFPFFTSSCLNLGCMSSWVHGAGFIMEQVLDNAQRLRLIASECATVYHGVPSVIQFMLDEFERGQQDLRRLRRVAYGGAAMPSRTIERIAQHWPWLDQVHVWGMTESGPAGAWLDPRWLPAKAGLMGCAMPYCELRVVDDACRAVPPGEPGELLFRGPSMAAGYFEDPGATTQTFRDGWLHTGDVVVEDEHGLLRFVDRKKDVINRGGLKISSAAVEAALFRIPGVADAAVVAIPHDQLGEDVAAFVVAAPEAVLDPAEMNRWCVLHLADYEVPRQWRIVAALPRNPMGKVLKRELRDSLLEEAAPAARGR